MIFYTCADKQAFKALLKYKISPDEESSVIAIVRIDSLIASVIDGFKDMIPCYRDYQSSWNEREVQFKTKR